MQEQHTATQSARITSAVACLHATTRNQRLCNTLSAHMHTK